MSWFGKKETENLDEDQIPSLPRLPELPSLPEMSEDRPRKDSLQQLPSYPSTTTGNLFSQNAIKDAVDGEEEDRGTLGSFSDFNPEITKAPLKSKIKEIPMTKGLSRKSTYQIPEEFKDADRKVREAEPIFIRLDKFEDSLNTFQKTKDKINEIEKMLRDIKTLKDEEEKELEYWEQELKSIRSQIDRIDEDLFSKIE